MLAAPITVHLKYERLGFFCYYCGIIGHAEDSCEKLYDVQEDDGVRNWGPDIRVEMNRRGRDGGNRQWTEEGSVSGNTVVQGGEMQLNAVLNVAGQNVTAENNGAIITEKQKRKDMMADLIRQQVQQKSLRKERIFNYDAMIAAKPMEEGRSTLNMTEEDDVVETDKKRLRDGTSKELGKAAVFVKQTQNSNQMQVDGNSGPEGTNMSTNTNLFLAAGPGNQACRDQ